ncbi:MAG: SUMF1/EgtB/PvdO family nonheme iron enzyme [Epsilonproteobacteria bacterium]|nr:SUMF1/EgtB/PvdO family nonheme iron enzyme [Campylobacterota bacterium]
METWDVFISHATKDKITIALPLYNQLQIHQLDPWIDKEDIKQGDSLFKAINDGLANSSYAIVIISPHFIKSEWTNKELETIFNLLVEKKIINIFLIYHKIDREILIQKYPLLTDTLAFNSEDGIEYIANRISDIIYNKEKIENTYPKNYQETIIKINEDSKIVLKTVSVEIEDKILDVSIYPVTFKEYDLYYYNKKDECYAKNYSYEFKRENYPVINISLDCVNKYIEWLNKKSNKIYRLPTSKEWDFIAQKNKIIDKNLNDYIWHRGNTKTIQPVGTKKAGKLGIYDMYGNIHEWCLDRQIRGNSFKYTLEDIYEKRDRVYSPKYSKDILGFRIIRESN